jgi:vacuolar iron transporter family protein
MRHREAHRAHRVGWLRAAVLGANDGLVSTASLVLGVAAAEASRGAVLTAGIAGLVAGAMSMAAGEYVSVSSQKDTEKADLERERAELKENPKHERQELATIYVERGVDRETAVRVAEQMMAHDSLGAHAREELGISELSTARPVQAAFASAGSFALGAALPLAVAAWGPIAAVIPTVAGTSLVFLALLGAVAARAGGAGAGAGATRVAVWGALAMGVTTAVGRLFGAVV